MPPPNPAPQDRVWDIQADVETKVVLWLEGAGSAGAFVLSARPLGGPTAVVPPDAGGGVGRSSWTLTPTAATSLEAIVTVTNAPAAGTPLRQSVSQNGAIVACRADPASPPLNRSGGGFANVQVATCKTNDVFRDSSALEPL